MGSLDSHEVVVIYYALSKQLNDRSSTFDKRCASWYLLLLESSTHLATRSKRSQSRQSYCSSVTVSDPLALTLASPLQVSQHDVCEQLGQMTFSLPMPTLTSSDWSDNGFPKNTVLPECTVSTTNGQLHPPFSLHGVLAFYFKSLSPMYFGPLTLTNIRPWFGPTHDVLPPFSWW